MTNSRKLIIEVVGDSSKLSRGLRQSETQLQSFGRRLDGVQAGRGAKGISGLSGVLKGGGIALGAGIAAQQLSALSTAASDLNEQVSKSRQVFGSSSSAIEKWSRTTADAIGVSRTEALTATGTFGNLFHTVGLGQQPAADMSRQLVQLAADLASFNNADPTEVLDAIRSGLIGEAEPLRRFGVLLSEARVQQRAMADTGKKNAKALTDQEKAVARYEIILGDTAQAQGDFARTSGDLAQQQKILQARLANTKSEIGEKLLPVQLQLTEALLDGIDAAEGFADALSKIKGPSGKQAFGWLQDGFQALLEFERKLGLPGIRPDALPTSAGLTSRPEEGTTGQSIAARAAADAKAATDRAGAAAARTGITAAQRNAWFDAGISRRLDRVQDIRTIKGQIAALQDIGRAIQQRMNATKDVTRKLTLEDQLVAVNREIRGLDAQLDEQAKERAAKIRARAKKQADALRDAASKVRKGVDDLAKALKGKDPSGGPLTPTTQLSDLILAGIGLGRDQERTLRARISHFNSAGIALAGAGSGSQRIVIENRLFLGDREITSQVSKSQQRTRKLNPSQRNGPNAGLIVY